jgi:nicotinate-nucleotide adenylyltransferase
MEEEARIGVFGGTFDPVHTGHLIMAEAARETLNLVKIVFVPAGQPWFKNDKTVSAAVQRLEMVRLATAAKAYFEVSTVEVERVGPSYTADTIAMLRAQWGPKVGLLLILGVDALLDLPQWKEPAYLVQECQFVVLPRSGRNFQELAVLESSLPGISARVIRLDVPEIEVSSTDIRDQVAHGLSIRDLVPEAVESYILEQGLYAPSSG